MQPDHPLSRLHIVSLGDTPKYVVDGALKAVRDSFELNCDVLTSEPRPDFALDGVRKQYDALAILEWLERRFRRQDEWVLALAAVDLYIPVLTFVFGEARLGGRCGLVSIARLREEFHGRPVDDAILLSRVEKSTIHEMGHMIGLVHCLDRNCVMHSSTSLADTDVKSTMFCPNCRPRLPRWCRNTFR